MSFQQREINTPHFAVPFRMGGRKGGAVYNEQNDIDDVVDRVKLVIAFPVGSRLDRPDFGTPDLLFKQRGGATAAALSTAILRWVGDEASFVIDDLTDNVDLFQERYRINLKSRIS